MIVQMPRSDERPPIPESMRSHYRSGELDRDGYVRAGYTPPPFPLKPKKCDYCGKPVDKCGCGAST